MDREREERPAEERPRAFRTMTASDVDESGALRCRSARAVAGDRRTEGASIPDI